MNVFPVARVSFIDRLKNQHVENNFPALDAKENAHKSGP